MRFRDDLERFLYYTSQIDYCYWVLSTMNKGEKDRTPIEIMIDVQTGFQKSKDVEALKSAIYHIGVIIRCKKALEYDTKQDGKTLYKIKKLLNTL